MVLGLAVMGLALALVLNRLGGPFVDRRPHWMTKARVAWTIYVLGAGLAVNSVIAFLPSKADVSPAAADAGPQATGEAASAPSTAPPREMIREAVEAALAAHDDLADREPPSPGHSLHTVLTLELPIRARDNFIFDSEDGRGTRVSLFMTADGVLTYRVSDRTRTEMLQVHEGADTFAFRRPSYVACAYGSTRTYSFLRMLISGREVAYRKTARLTVIDPKASFSFGADVRNSNHGTFDFSGYYDIKGTTPSAREERQLLEKESTEVGLERRDAVDGQAPPP